MTIYQYCVEQHSGNVYVRVLTALCYNSIIHDADHGSGPLRLNILFQERKICGLFEETFVINQI